MGCVCGGVGRSPRHLDAVLRGTEVGSENAILLGTKGGTSLSLG